MGRKARALGLCLFGATIALILVLAHVFPAYAAAPTAKVVAVYHPESVLAGAKFPVTVTVWYSERLLADVGIWDAGEGAMIRSVTLISSFTGPGKANFTFQLTAPSSEGHWNLVAITRVWWQDGWYQDPSDATMPFTILHRIAVQLVLSSEGADSTITLDGTTYPLRSMDSISLPLQPGIHTLEAPQVLQSESGARFVFQDWSDGLGSNPRKLLILQNMRLAARYRTEYYLSVKSEMGIVAGEGWYVQGSQATFAVVPIHTTLTSLFGLISHDYSFTGWTGDVGSSDPIASVEMNGPKTVRAEWTHSGVRIDFNAIADLLLLASVPLGIRAVYVHARRMKGGSMARTTKRIIPILLLVSVVVGASTFVPSVQGQLEPKVSVVRIGDADWYYWNQAGGDTCVLWLGGGVFWGPVFPSYSYFWINPFDYESFGTIQFIQDMARYYCVIALAKGSFKAYNAVGNRTIYQEAYTIRSSIIAEVHDWIKKQGYEHTFLVGYSVGGQAAAVEVALRDPEGWSSSDGIVLITVPIADSIILNARKIRTNLMVVYGGNLPRYEATGRLLYENAPSEGWKGTYYYHKEFHVLREVGHEIWTVRDTGEYSPKVVNLLVSFIESSKALQLGPDLVSIAQQGFIATALGAVNLSAVHAPLKVSSGQAFLIDVIISYKQSATSPFLLAALDTARNQFVSSSVLLPSGNGSMLVRLLVPPVQNVSKHSLSLVLFESADRNWTLAGRYSLQIAVTDLVTLTVEVSVPGITLFLDGLGHVMPASGRLQTEVVRGRHIIQVPAIVPQDNSSRFLFTQWDDSTNSPTRQIYLDNDMTVNAIYRKQYFITVESAHNPVLGGGWYDENSTTAVQIQQPASENWVFARWTGDSEEPYPRSFLFVDSPKSVEAVWISKDDSEQTYPLITLVWFSISMAVLVVLLIWNLTERASARGS